MKSILIKVKKCFSNFKSNDGHKVPKTISSLSFAFFLDLTLNSKNKKITVDFTPIFLLEILW